MKKDQKKKRKKTTFRRVKARKKKAPPKKIERRPKVGTVEQMLLKMKKDLLSEITRSRGEESDVAKQDIGDVYDISSQDRERDLILTLSAMERTKLREIDDTLRKIKDKTYGICEECGEKIPPARIKILPFARVCVDCKSKLEREEQMKKALEEEGIHQSIIYTESEEEET